MVTELSNQDKDVVETSLRALGDTQKMINRAKVAGLDMTMQQARLDEAMKKLSALKQAYWPTGKRSA